MLCQIEALRRKYKNSDRCAVWDVAKIKQGAKGNTKNEYVIAGIQCSCVYELLDEGIARLGPYAMAARKCIYGGAK